MRHARIGRIQLVLYIVVHCHQPCESASTCPPNVGNNRWEYYQPEATCINRYLQLKTWLEARDACRGLEDPFGNKHRRLVAIWGRSMLDYIIDNIVSENTKYWIGIWDWNNDNEDFKFINWIKATFLPWAPGEPTNKKNSIKCVYLYNKHYYVGNCQDKMRFICEILDDNACLKKECSHSCRRLEEPRKRVCECPDEMHLANRTHCACPEGLQISSHNKCTDIDECLTENGGCGQLMCVNTYRNNTCQCYPDDTACLNSICPANVRTDRWIFFAPAATCMNQKLEGKSWYRAKGSCMEQYDPFGNKYRRLVVLRNRVMYNFIVDNVTLDNTEYWIGARTFNKTSQVFVWMNGLTVNFLPWGPGQPKMTKNSLHCLYVYNRQYYVGDCHEKRKFVCEVLNDNACLMNECSHTCRRLEKPRERVCECPDGMHLVNQTHCRCPLGSRITNHTNCTDCEDKTFAIECGGKCACDFYHTLSCDDIDGSCTCIQGWTGVDCSINVDECQSDIAECQAHTICVDTPGSYTCVCSTGFYDYTNSQICEPCRNDTYYGQDCAEECACVKENTLDCNHVTGACFCLKGWQGVDCESNINECEVYSNYCPDEREECHDLPGSAKCNCKSGHNRLGGVCTDRDECSDGWHGGCEHNCTNTIGSRVCTCMDSFTLLNQTMCERIMAKEGSMGIMFWILGFLGPLLALIMAILITLDKRRKKITMEEHDEGENVDNEEIEVVDDEYVFNLDWDEFEEHGIKYIHEVKGEEAIQEEKPKPGLYTTLTSYLP